MKSFSQFFRLIYIQYVFAKHGIDQVIFSIRLFSPFWFLTFFNPWNWFRPKNSDRGTAIRLALEELGPIFVKFGQVLSTRRDILPEDIADALTLLQDNVFPFSSAEARAIIEKTLQKPIVELFKSFDDNPLAAASIAQVHSATLLDGRSVVVKILRPHIRKKIQRDIDLLYTIANLAERSIPRIRHLKPKAIIREFELSLIDEVDLRCEAGNASQLRRNFAYSPALYIPHVEWPYTNSQVMVMERVYGIPIIDREALLAHKVDLPKLAARGIELFFMQVFRDAFFHADMHPGNIFVSPEHPEDPQFIYVDFGIVGTLTDQDKRYIAENLYAFFNRDYRRVAELHQECGWVDSTIRLDRFESAIRSVSEPIFEKPLKEISFGQVIFNLIQTARRFHFNIQPQLVLLQKTLLSVEGLARYLDPDLDLWTTAKPFLERWIKEQIGFKAFVRNTKKSLPFLAEHLPEFPRLMHHFLVTAEKERRMRIVYEKSQQKTVQLKKSASHRVSFIVGLVVGIAISAIAVYGVVVSQL